MKWVKPRNMVNKVESPSAYKITDGQLRIKASRCMRHLAIPQGILGFLATVAGIATLILGSLQLTFPFYIPADLVTGFTCIMVGGVAYRIHSDTANGKRKKNTHCLMTVYGCLTLLCMCLSVLSLILSAYILFTCTDENNPKPHCLSRRRPKIAFAVISCVIESFVLVFSLLIFWKFSYYRSSFDIRQTPVIHRVIKTEKASRRKRRSGGEVGFEEQDVYIARCPNCHAYSQGTHVCMHCKPTAVRSGMGLPNGLPPPYTRIAPY